jgi:hypothetical protein
MSGYYEWQHTTGIKQPQPWYFTARDAPNSEIFAKSISLLSQV